MTRALVFSALLVISLAVSAAAQAPDRSAAPKPGPAPALTLPAIQKQALSNGVPVWIVETHGVPVVQINLIVKAGSAADPTSKFGLASLAAAMLDEGAAGRDALAIADAVDHLGADLSTSSSYDASFVNLHVPVARLAEALAIMADVALRPSFGQKDLDRLREERLAGLTQTRDNPAAIASVAFPLMVFGPSHRYGISMMGTGETLPSFETEDLRQFHAAQYRPDRAALVVVGDVTPASVLPALEKGFGAWKAAAPAASARGATDAPALKARQVFIVDKPGAPQSQIRIGAVGVARSTPDYHALQVLNTILGGSFTSRLNQNLRETHGYTYGASSGFDMRLAAGPFLAGAGVQTDKTAESITEFFNELNGILRPVPAEELAKAKNYVALRFPNAFETTRGIAAQLTQLIVYGLPDDYFSTYVQKVQAVTAADLSRVAAKYIQPDKLAVVVVGDRQTIEPTIKALNLGPITALKVEDVVR
jgi:predicted Zn-dependent peptidase